LPSCSEDRVQLLTIVHAFGNGGEEV